MRYAEEEFAPKCIHFFLLSHLFCSFIFLKILRVVFRMTSTRPPILRLLRTTEVGKEVAPKKVGIDDWAWKRGHRYGTLICDLEREIPIDLLPDCTVETVTTWFQHHPSV